MNAIISETTATGSEIEMIIERLEYALEGVKRGHGLIALLSLALVIQKPDISQDLLQDGVRDVSRYMCLILDEAGMDLKGKQVLN